MPVIYIYAINTTAGRDNKLYESPIYRWSIFADGLQQAVVLIKFSWLPFLFGLELLSLLYHHQEARQDGNQLHRLDRFRERHQSETLGYERGCPALRYQIK